VLEGEHFRLWHQFLKLSAFLSTVRTPKVDILRQSFAVYGSDLEIIGFDDLVNGDWTDALKGQLMFFAVFAIMLNIGAGVDAVIHAAAPLPGTQDVESALNVSLMSLCACPCMPNMVYRMPSKEHSTSYVLLKKQGLRTLCL
jgi:hypothetical protein